MTVTRQQEYMQKALRDVQGVPDTRRKGYGALCHQVPPLVLANGLGMTVAFVQSKSRAGEPPNAHWYVLRSIKRLLGREDDDDLNTYVADLSVEKYMLATFTLLDAWVYYKRFAESYLGVTPGEDVRDDNAGGGGDA